MHSVAWQPWPRHQGRRRSLVGFLTVMLAVPARPLWDTGDLNSLPRPGSGDLCHLPRRPRLVQDRCVAMRDSACPVRAPPPSPVSLLSPLRPFQ